jgi:hypothetical protein
MAESHLLTTKHPDVNMTPDFSHIKTKAIALNENGVKHNKPNQNKHIQFNSISRYISVVMLAVVIAYVTYRNESRLSDYDRKF